MSLLHKLPYAEYIDATKFTSDTCELLARLAKIRKTYHEYQKPGQQLIIDLDRHGLSLSQYHRLLLIANGRVPTQEISTENFRPQSKVAILIGNSNYNYLRKLITPRIDCKLLGDRLKSLGFIVVVINDVDTTALKNALRSILELVPPESYCVIFYAGHGFELCGIKYALGVESPCDNLMTEHGVTVNFILKAVERCRPELCVLLMDMCRNYLERDSNPALFNEVPDVEKYQMEGNLVIGYSTSSAKSAYEEIQIECSASQIIEDSEPLTYELRSEDYDCVVGVASQYVGSLCRHIRSKLYIGDILDRVSEDLQNAMKKQTPLKVQSGQGRRYLYDRLSGDHHELVRKLRKVVDVTGLSNNCTILDIV